MTNFDDQIRRSAPVLVTLPATFQARLGQTVRLHHLRRLLRGVLLVCLLCTALAASTRNLGYIVGLVVARPYEFLADRQYLATLAASLPWLNLAIIAGLGAFLALLWRLETNLASGRKTDITRSSIMTRIITHTRRFTIIGGVLGASLMGVSAYAALNPSPGVQQAQAELKRAVDAKGNLTYTIGSHTYVVDPKLTDAERRVTILDLARQTSASIHNLLKAYNGSQGWPTGPHGEQVIADFYGRIISVTSDRLVIEGPGFWTNDGSQQQYEFKTNSDTVFQNGDTKITAQDLRANQTISLAFYADSAASSQELAKASKTLYAGIIVPFTASEYVDVLNSGGVQEQSFPGQSLLRDTRGKAPVTAPSGQ